MCLGANAFAVTVIYVCVVYIKMDKEILMTYAGRDA